METVAGAVPEKEEAVSQLPPSAVMAVRVQFNVPVPALRSCTLCEAGFPPLVGMKKLTWPCTLSKYVPVGGNTVSVTGIVIGTPSPCGVRTICPVYVPAARLAGALTAATMVVGVPSQQLVEDELVALDHSLDKLSQMNPRQATVVESRFFGGMEMAEISELLGISEATVLRDWRAAKAWLAQEVRRA